MAIPIVVFQVVTSATLSINIHLRQDLNLPLILSKNLDFVVVFVYAPSYPAPAVELLLIAIHQHSWHCNNPDAKLWTLIFFPCLTIAATSTPVVASWLAAYQGFFSEFVANCSAVCDDSCCSGAEPAIWWPTCPLGHCFLPAVRDLLLDWK